jgi:peptidoglycan/xylan/chitin deacetylase (PgdA/CDA1 family)
MLTGSYFARTVNIIYYHSTAERAYSRLNFFSRSLTSDRLRADLAWLAKHFRFAPLSEAIAQAGEQDSAGRPPLAVTFDDGLDLIEDRVAQVLDEFHVSATAFINTETVGNQTLMWRHALAVCTTERGSEEVGRQYSKIAALRGIGADSNVMRASLQWPHELRGELVDELLQALDLGSRESLAQREKPYFTFDHLHHWLENGHSIGNHSATHPLCDTLPAEAYERELGGPNRWLAKNFGITGLPFTYPFGRSVSNESARSLMELNGFSSMAGVRGFSPIGTDPWRLDRYPGESGLSAGLFGRAILRYPFRAG